MALYWGQYRLGPIMLGLERNGSEARGAAEREVSVRVRAAAAAEDEAAEATEASLWCVERGGRESISLRGTRKRPSIYS